MAQWKQARQEDGARAPVASWLHAPTYAATQAATNALFYRTVGVRLAQLAGAVTEGVLAAVMAWQ